nr:retrovirus-related Pol polyprotein from transposon TNT 1-94 [Tanacetum cinerariifolium]
SSRPFTLGQGGAPGKQRVITCYNCKGEGHMSEQCTKPRRKRDAEWFKDKVLLVQAQANGQEIESLKHDEKASTSYEYSQEIESLKHTLSEYLKEKESFEQKITILKDDFLKEESRNIDRELALEKEVKELNNIVVIGKSEVIVVPDSENTLMHAEESRSKMIAKQNDP